MLMWIYLLTDHSVLDAEAQLVLGVWPLDLDLDHRGTRDCGQLHRGLVLTVLKYVACYKHHLNFEFSHYCNKVWL